MAPQSTPASAVPAITAWFVLNIIIGNLNGWILRNGFTYPVLLTVVHMVCCWLLAGASLLSCMHPGEAARPANRNAIRKVRVLSLAFCASVASGNIALQYIYVSFAQMVTAAGPLFTIMLMYTMSGKRYSRGAYASMVPMCGGVMMCTAGEVSARRARTRGRHARRHLLRHLRFGRASAERPCRRLALPRSTCTRARAQVNFHWLGFAAVVAATVLRGVKSIIQGRLLTSPEDKFDSLTLLCARRPALPPRRRRAAAAPPPRRRRARCVRGVPLASRAGARSYATARPAARAAARARGADHMSGCSLLPLGVYVALFEHAALFDPKLTTQRGALLRWAVVVLSGFVALSLIHI